MVIKWEHCAIVSMFIILFGFYFESYLVLLSPFVFMFGIGLKQEITGSDANDNKTQDVEKAAE